MKRIYLHFFGLLVGSGLAASAFALADAEAEKTYNQAAKTFQQTEEQLASVETSARAPQKLPYVNILEQVDVSLISQDAENFHTYTSSTEQILLEDVVLAIDVDDTSIENVIATVIKKAEGRVGPWTVKWRLKPENNHLKEERVNLVAESSLGRFLNLMTDRVRNMTGVQLFVSVFEASRIIIISDTYSS